MTDFRERGPFCPTPHQWAAQKKPKSWHTPLLLQLSLSALVKNDVKCWKIIMTMQLRVCLVWQSRRNIQITNGPGICDTHMKRQSKIIIVWGCSHLGYDLFTRGSTTGWIINWFSIRRICRFVKIVSCNSQNKPLRKSSSI